jgi:transcriptional regulator with XRE-family HTH domain
MSKRPIITDKLVDIRNRASRVNYSTAEVCKLAGIDPSTWWRWEKGQNPLPKSIRKLEIQLDKLERSAARSAASVNS